MLGRQDSKLLELTDASIGTQISNY